MLRSRLSSPTTRLTKHEIASTAAARAKWVLRGAHREKRALHHLISQESCHHITQFLLRHLDPRPILISSILQHVEVSLINWTVYRPSNPRRNPLTSDTNGKAWEEHTTIDEANLQKHLFETGRWEENKLQIASYCVEPNVDTLNFDGFITYLRDKFHLFAFPDEQRKEMTVPGIEAQERADFSNDPRTNGLLGELILFVLVEAILGLPIICHKISLKQEPVQEVKGSDGLFFGDFEGHESLAIGEAKIYKRLSQGIDSALASIDRFHGMGGRAQKDHELNVASSTLSDDLSDEETSEIIEAISPEPSDHRTIHPIFIGYEEDWLHQHQQTSTDQKELKEKITEEIKNSDLETKVKNKISNDYTNLEKHWILFFFHPLEDVDEFREDLQEALYPHSSRH